jgi:ribonuclease HIII
MSNFSLVADNNKINEFIKENKNSLANKPNNPHIKYFLRVKGSVISIFNNNKILIQGEKIDKDILKFFGAKKNKNHREKQEENNKKFDKYIGCDEVGVGDYFGGLTCCACYLEKEYEPHLIDLGVKDSKKLSDSEIIKLANKIKHYVKYEIAYFSPSEYNEFIALYHNTHIAKSFLHNNAIKNLIANNNLPNDTPVVLDQFVDKKNYYSYFEKMKIEPHEVDVFVTRGESAYLAVAAASILARHYFLLKIYEMRAEVDINFGLGASNPNIIEDAKKIYKNLGEEELKKYVKIDFSLTEKVIK